MPDSCTYIFSNGLRCSINRNIQVVMQTCTSTSPGCTERASLARGPPIPLLWVLVSSPVTHLGSGGSWGYRCGLCLPYASCTSLCPTTHGLIIHEARGLRQWCICCNVIVDTSRQFWQSSMHNMRAALSYLSGVEFLSDLPGKSCC